MTRVFVSRFGILKLAVESELLKPSQGRPPQEVQLDGVGLVVKVVWAEHWYEAPPTSHSPLPVYLLKKTVLPGDRAELKMPESRCVCLPGCLCPRCFKRQDLRWFRTAVSPSPVGRLTTRLQQLS